ncbi:hypothetical protein ACMFMG_005743 [Clarireedia jacksonii]
MNWTGGRLQRHSGKWSKNGTLTSRQKEHFAKVQTNLRSRSRKNSPIKWPVFDKIQPGSPEKQDSHDYSNSWRNVEEISESTEGELRRKRSSQHQRSTENQKSTSRQTRTRSDQKSERYPLVEINQRRIPDDDLYNATPSPQRIKSELATSGRSPLGTRNTLSKRVSPDPADDSMDAKRRRLLLKGDWIGLGARRPPPLKFVPSRHDEEIGRRRKLTDGHRARYARQQAVISSPFVTKRARDMETQHGGVSRNNVRISIGNKVVLPDLSSSSRSTKHIHTTPRSLLARKRQTLSPDEMLLDNDSLIRDMEDIDSDRFLHASEATSFQRVKDRRLADHKGVCCDSKPRVVHREDAIQHVEPTRNVPERSTASDEPESVASSFSRTAVRSVCDAGVKQPIPRRHHKHPVLHLSSPQGNSSVMAHIGQPKPIVPEDQLLDNQAWKTWIAPSTKSSICSERSLLGRGISISPGVSAAPSRRQQAICGSIFGHDNSEVKKAMSWEMEDQESVEYGTQVSEERGECSPLRDCTGRWMDGNEVLHPSPNDEGSNSVDMWPETSSSVPWDPPRGSSFSQTEPPTLHLARREHGKDLPKTSLCNYEQPSYKTFDLSQEQVRRRTEIDNKQAPTVKTAVKEAIVINQPSGSTEEPDDIWMKFVFGENNEDVDIKERTRTDGELDPNINPTSSSSWRVNPPSEMSKYSLNRGKGQGDSQTFSTFVHNSNDSQSPLEPKYIYSGRRNLVER